MLTLRANTGILLVALTLASACGDSVPFAPEPDPQPSLPAAVRPDLVALQCTVNAVARSFGCAPVKSASNVNGDYIVGGQGINVKLTSSNVSYDVPTQTLGADVTVQNLLPDALGTIDGVTLSATGVRVFFDSDPVLTSGSGTVSVQNADGQATFTNTNQDYFQYSQVLAPNAVSSSKRWLFNLSNGTTFSFVVYISAPVQSRLVVSEIMANPQVAADASGEWIEIYNAGRTDVDLAGWAIKSNSGQSITITPNATTCGSVGCTLIVPKGGFVVLSNNRNSATNGGVPVEYQWPDGTGPAQINLANGNASEFVAVASPAGVEVDRVTWNSTTVVPNGISLCLSDLAADNSLLTNAAWQQSAAAWSGSGGDKGTPGAANSGCGSTPVAGPIVTVTVSPSTAGINVSETHQYTASGRDANGVAAATTFTWTIDDPSIATINASSGVVTGVAAGTTTLHATSLNGITGSATVSVTQSFSTAIYRNHLEFGTPTDADPSDDIIITRAQYVLSYNQSRGGPNWVSWNLNKTHFGDALRCDCFSADPLLPVGVTPIVTSDYTGSGYSRGHMVMSEQRTATDADNRATFYMTNVLPQYQDLNGGPWLRFETFNNDLARLNNKELYIISGGVFSASPATLNNAGKVAIPTSTWKVVVVMDSGQTLANVSSAADIKVYAVNMPNVLGISSQPWNAYVTTVDAIEAATGYDLLSALPDAIENAVEAAMSPTSFTLPNGGTTFAPSLLRELRKPASAAPTVAKSGHAHQLR